MRLEHDIGLYLLIFLEFDISIVINDKVYYQLIYLLQYTFNFKRIVNSKYINK